MMTLTLWSIHALSLESQGYEVRTAGNGDLALRLMFEDKPDVLLLDVMMCYALEGLNVTRQMRDDPQLRDVPVSMVSAIVGKEEAGIFPTDEYLALDLFLTKPIDPADLLQQVARLAQSRTESETTNRSRGGGKKEEWWN